MNIKPIENIQMKQPIIKRIKNAFNKRFANLKELVCDVFEKNTGEKFYIHEGKKLRCHSSKFRARELPNSVTGPTDWQGVTWSRVSFYPEDLEKMKNMNIDERLAFKRKLLEQKRYIDND